MIFVQNEMVHLMKREYVVLFLFWAGSVSTIGCINRNCNENQPLVEGKLVRKFHYQKIDQKKWTAELWVEGTLNRSWKGIPVSVRLSSRDPNVGSIPPVKAFLKIRSVGEKEKQRTVFITPTFEECAKIKKHFEVVISEESEGEITAFPQRKGSWQVSLLDPFNSDITRPGSIPFEPGNYLVSIKVEVEGGPTFSFADFPQKLFHNPKKLP
jgi:hypothetical protein